MKKIINYIKAFLQALYIVCVVEPIANEKGRSIYSRADKQKMLLDEYNKLETLKNQLK